MLRGIDPLLNPDVLRALASMGHGDDLAIVDKNFPADSVARSSVLGHVLRMDGVPIQQVVASILTLLPLDAYVDDPFRRMEVVGEPNAVPQVQRDVHALVRSANGPDTPMVGIERQLFYEEARKAYAVIATSDPVGYGCFLLRKGVIN
jgi:L-fucose mutarotase